MYEVYVVLYNGYGMELSREKCEDMQAAAACAMDLCATSSLEVGDSIRFEE